MSGVRSKAKGIVANAVPTAELTHSSFSKKLPGDKFIPLERPTPFPETLLVADSRSALPLPTPVISLESEEFIFINETYIDRENTDAAHFTNIQALAKREKWPVLSRERFAAIRRATIELPAKIKLLKMGQAGHGMCAMQVFPEQTMFEYTGMYRKDSLAEMHSSGRVDNRDLFTFENQDGEVIASIDGTKGFRGFASMIQHASSTTEGTEFDRPEDEKLVQLPNLDVHKVIVEGEKVPRLVVRVTKKIEVGDGFFYDYGPNYFPRLRMTPLRFNKTTLEPLDTRYYRTTRVILFGSHPVHPGKAFLRLELSRAEINRCFSSSLPLALGNKSIIVPEQVLEKMINGDLHSEFYIIPLQSCIISPRFWNDLCRAHPELTASSRLLPKEKKGEKPPAPKICLGSSGTGKMSGLAVYASLFASDRAVCLPYNLTREMKSQVIETAEKIRKLEVRPRSW